MNLFRCNCDPVRRPGRPEISTFSPVPPRQHVIRKDRVVSENKILAHPPAPRSLPSFIHELGSPLTCTNNFHPLPPAINISMYLCIHARARACAHVSVLRRRRHEDDVVSRKLTVRRRETGTIIDHRRKRERSIDRARFYITFAWFLAVLRSSSFVRSVPAARRALILQSVPAAGRYCILFHEGGPSPRGEQAILLDVTLTLFPSVLALEPSFGQLSRSLSPSLSRPS